MQHYLMNCRKCGTGWLDTPGQFGKRFGAGCPFCGSLYWDWKISDAEIQVLTEKDEGVDVDGG